jgi:hypothetical protein
LTQPTVRVWQQIVLGWVLHRGPATVTGIVRTLGTLADRHWTVYHKFFYRAAWRLETLSAYLMMNVIAPLIIESGQVNAETDKPVIDLNIDDTTAGRYGRHVAHAGWFRDASATGPATKGAVIHWAHNWIIGAVTLRLPRWKLIRWVLPATFALYRKKNDCGPDHPFATRQVIAAGMVCKMADVLPGMEIRVAADGQYATREMVANLPEHVSLVSRIRRDAAVYALPPAPRPGQRGRPRLQGKRLPAPRHLAARRKKGWTTATLLKQGRKIQRELLGITCLWYHVCHAVPIRLVIVRDPAGRQKDDFLFCTNAKVPDEQIAQRYLDRWGVEECILEAKQPMGFENTRGWCSRTVNRQAPLAMVLVTLVKVWYARCAVNEPSLLPQATPWNPCKSHPSFLDMLAALRRVLWQHRISSNSTLTARVRYILETVSYALSHAA